MAETFEYLKKKNNELNKILNELYTYNINMTLKEEKEMDINLKMKLIIEKNNNIKKYIEKINILNVKINYNIINKNYNDIYPVYNKINKSKSLPCLLPIIEEIEEY